MKVIQERAGTLLKYDADFSAIRTNEETGIITKQSVKLIKPYGNKGGKIEAVIRFDDDCGNGPESFSITGSVYETKRRNDCDMCGCIHGEIIEHFPELKPFIKWHLMSADSPLHYIANTVYHAGNLDCNGLAKGKERDLNAARSCAVWPEATDVQLCLPKAELTKLLKERQEGLIKEFKAAILSLGLKWPKPAA